MNTTRHDTAAAPGLISLERLIFLIDGVFAITLTLLVLDLRPPELAGPGLAEGLKGMLPRLLVYLLAFYVIANQWTIHVRSFRLLGSADVTLIWLCLANLLFVTLLPASTALLGAYPLDPLAALCFSINNLLMSLSVSAVWTYVYCKRSRLAPDADPHGLSGHALVWLYVALGYLVAAPLGFISNYLAAFVWVAWPYLVTLLWFRAGRERKASRPA
jgi:uncharacterized membrane protein